MSLTSLLTVLCFAGAALGQAGTDGGAPSAMGPASTGPFGEGPVTALPNLNASLTALAQQQALADIPNILAPDNSGGSGPYKANYSAPPAGLGLSNHTIFAPKVLPPGVKLPVIVWGNGGCSGQGTGFAKFLTEIASHGYYIVANGAVNAPATSLTYANDLPDAIDWIYKNAGTGELATVDKTKLAAAGQSCGGIQAYSASLDFRVTLTAIFDSGLISQGNTKLFEKLHAPIGWFLGGPTDIAYEMGEHDYSVMPSKIPVVKLNLPVGHGGTYMEFQGGKFGKAAVDFFDWQLNGKTANAAEFLDPPTSSLTKAGWSIVSRGWNSTTTKTKRSADAFTPVKRRRIVIPKVW